MKKLSMCAAAFALAAGLLLTPQMSKAAEVVWPKKMVLSIPMSGNVVALVVQSIAKTIEKHTPIERVIVQPIGGPASWVPKMEKGQVDLAVNGGPDTVELIQGLGAWTKTGAKPFLRTVVTGSRNLYGVITVPGKGINSYSDLKGKVAFVRQPGSLVFERLAKCVLESTGLKMEDLKADLTLVNFREAASAINEGRADVSLSTGSGPFMMELAQGSGENVYISPSPEEAERLMKLMPRGYYIGSLPAKAPYFNNSSAIDRAIMYRNAIYCRADLHPEIVYGIIKAVDENRAEWESVNASAKDWGTPYDMAPPYHEGVVRYYKEKGLWDGKIVENQKYLLDIIKAEK